jgi:hypothetical protein
MRIRRWRGRKGGTGEGMMFGEGLGVGAFEKIGGENGEGNGGGGGPEREM